MMPGVLPGMAVVGVSGMVLPVMVGGGSVNDPMTKTQRELHFGNIPPGTTEEELKQFLGVAILQVTPRGP